MQPLLEVEGLKKTYPGFQLNGVSFSIYEDCITGFIGANGAGKTTCIRSILRLISHEAGTIKFKGKDISKAEKSFKNSIGVVFDEGFFYDELTLTQMKNLIASSYFLIYLYCCVVFRIEMQVIPQLAAVDFVRSAVIVFWIQVICMGIFLPIQYRFGYEKTKLFAMLLVVAGPVLMSVANSVVVPVTVTQSFSAVPGVMYIVLWVIGGALWLFSMFVSKKIFSSIDLF